MRSTLIEAVERCGPRTVAVVGLAKNCGKTTAFNRLIEGYGELGLRVGATSAGRDGEMTDALTMRPKPAIELPDGALAATAELALAAWTAPYEVMARLGVATAMGEVLLVRATGEGCAELAGPPTVATVMKALAEMRRLGAERILVDGAFDRIAVGHPGLADAVVLAGGAVLGASPETVARTIAHRVRLLGLLQPPSEVCLRMAEAADSLGASALLFSDGASPRRLDESALAAPGRAAAAALKATHLLCGGAVTDELLRSLTARRARLAVVARDPTRVFIEPETLAAWEDSGGGLLVLRRVTVAAVATNPHNPTGPSLDPEQLIDEVASKLKGVPVYDVVRGLSRNDEAVAAFSKVAANGAGEERR